MPLGTIKLSKISRPFGRSKPFGFGQKQHHLRSPEPVAPSRGRRILLAYHPEVNSPPHPHRSDLPATQPDSATCITLSPMSMEQTECYGAAPRSSTQRQRFFGCPSTRFESNWRRPGSNRQPPACKAGALPIELRPRREKLESCEARMTKVRDRSSFGFRHSGSASGRAWIRTTDLSFIRAAL